MNRNSLYAGILATTLLIISGSASFATPSNQTQLTVTTDETEDTFDDDDGIVTVSIGEGSNATVQYYTFTPQSVEINAGDSVTWFSPSEISDIHTVTFVTNSSIISDILLPFAVPAGATGASFDLVPPFNLGEPIIIPTPDGREAIVALNKQAWYPAVYSSNNQTTYLEGTDIQATLNNTVTALNSGIIMPSGASTGETQPNATATSTNELSQVPLPVSLTNGSSTTTRTTTNATGAATDVLTAPGSQSMSQPIQAPMPGQQLPPPFPPVSSFTVTFEDPGVYPYFCAIHPWMTGQVVVREQATPQTQGLNQTGTEGLNQTGTEGLNQTGTEGLNQTGTEGAAQPSSANPIFG
jgi:plastocyanin